MVIIKIKTQQSCSVTVAEFVLQNTDGSNLQKGDLLNLNIFGKHGPITVTDREHFLDKGELIINCNGTANLLFHLTCDKRGVPNRQIKELKLPAQKCLPY